MTRSEKPAFGRDQVLMGWFSMVSFLSTISMRLYHFSITFHVSFRDAFDFELSLAVANLRSFREQKEQMWFEESVSRVAGESESYRYVFKFWMRRRLVFCFQYAIHHCEDRFMPRSVHYSAPFAAAAAMKLSFVLFSMGLDKLWAQVDMKMLLMYCFLEN